MDEGLTASVDEETAMFQTETFIEAPEGETLSGELFIAAQKLSKEKNIPMSQAFLQLRPDVKITKWIFPGKGVPEIAKRSGKK